jgi:hypothetical protein
VTALPLASLVADTPDGLCGATSSAKLTVADVAEWLVAFSVAVAHSWYGPFHARLGIPEKVQSVRLDDVGVAMAENEEGFWPSWEAKICTVT